MINEAITLLNELLIKNNIAEHHGLDHAKTVMHHVQQAIKCSEINIPEKDQIIILLVALLHDADDTKLFKTKNNQNARDILLSICADNIEEIIKLINCISVSKNNDSIPDEAKERPWLLYPRYADRLEAIGEIGMKRCYEVTMEFKNPLYTENTPKAISKTELYHIATPDRYKNYTKSSVSMIDHYYDKLLHIGKFDSGNKYLDNLSKERQGLMEDVCLAFGRGELEDFIKKLKN